MYIKKSILSGMIMAFGACLLVILTILFCFTEIAIPRVLYIVLWVTCVIAVVETVSKVEK